MTLHYDLSLHRPDGCPRFPGFILTRTTQATVLPFAMVKTFPRPMRHPALKEDPALVLLFFCCVDIQNASTLREQPAASLLKRKGHLLNDIPKGELLIQIH